MGPALFVRRESLPLQGNTADAEVLRLTMKKIRVLVFTNSFRIGGSERQALELIKRVDPARFEITVACFQKDGPLLTDLPLAITQPHEFPLERFFHPSTAGHAFRFIRLLKRNHIQVIQCFDFYSNLFAIPLARLAGVPVILASRRDEASMRTPAQRRAELWSYYLATGVVANAEAIKDQLVRRDRVSSGKVWVIHNGLDVDRFDRHEGSPSEGTVSRRQGLTVAVVANLRPEKGHFVFLDAAKRLTKSNPQIRFLIVGDGVMRDRIKTRVSELGLTEQVQLTGAVKDIPALLRSVDIAVLPSLKNEGFPNAVMEAMAASVPVVVTDTGGTSELVIDGLTGYMVQPGDAAALGDRIGRLCGDAEMRRKMGEAGRQRIIDHFTSNRIARKFEALYSRLASASCIAGE
jgi:glycosyltransferase involved in cell wall biosynthesis